MTKDIVVSSSSTQTLGIVEGDLVIGEEATVKGEGMPPRINVTGTVRCRGNCTLDCSLSAENMVGKGDITVNGDLEVGGYVSIRTWGFGKSSLNVLGSMSAKKVEVEAHLSVGKDFETEHVDVGGRILVKGKTKAQNIDVGGSFTGIGDVEAKLIDVGGSVTIESQANVEKLDVGGRAVVKGGRVGRVDVGGSFESKDSLEFDSIDVGGTVRLAGDSKGGNIDVGGSCKVDGDLNSAE